MRLISVLFCLSLLSSLQSCAPAPVPVPASPSPSASATPLRTTMTATEARLDAFIAAKGKRLGKRLIDALKNYQDLRGAYPEQLEALVTEGLLEPVVTTFDVTDFDTPRDPEIVRFVFDGRQPKVYQLEYTRQSESYELKLVYTVLDIIALSYTPEMADWKEMRVF